MKIGIYGGTFNPPHLGHLAAARAAIAALDLDRLMLVPAAIPPHKELPEGTPPPADRLAMAGKLADALLLPKVAEVDSLEMDRPGPSYTADTVELIHSREPEAQLWLLVGSDMFLTLHTWKEPERILKYASVCAFHRTQEDEAARFVAQKARLERDYGARVQLIPVPGLVEISSTRLR